MRKTGCGGVGSRGIVDLKVLPPAAHTPVPNQSPTCYGLTPKGSYPANQHQWAKSKRVKHFPAHVYSCSNESLLVLVCKAGKM
ncbi:hypothetical protein Pmani_028034 [Petrolisthes manimaculis]|uniref:Uncharacterized protein n=1 Tax=Petrolisthes manimaculis TaxID=1843537 RepID=A0AAE1P080_9EUCA|nr:hypothetical protein Pmani_028034 [Petrolisthes manimaculis]